MRVSARVVHRFILAALGIAYVVWSQVALHRADVALETERERVYNIADHLELWKELAIRHHARLDREALAKDARKVQLADAAGAGLPLSPGDRVYTLTYDPLDPSRRRKLDRYFSELVLHNYFYVVTDSRGEIKDMFWDKP